jgi:ATP-dependent Lon protease
MFESDRLPIFPLGIVLYPGESVPLHIFEDRYRLMIRERIELDLPFGIVLAENEEMEDVGCTARVSRIIHEYEDGRLDVLVTGQDRFRVETLHSDQPYLTADVEPYGPAIDRVNTDLKERVITQHMRLLELLGETLRPVIYEDVQLVSFVVARNAGLDLKQRQALLEMPAENDRVEFLISYFTELIPRLLEARETHRRIGSNGHLKTGE